MKINLAPDFPLPGFWSDRACAEAVYEFDGQRYYLRQMDRHILYRTADQPDVEHTLWVTCRVMPGGSERPVHKDAKTWTPAEYPEAVFQEQIRARQNGRLALYACPLARDCVAALFFTPDGTGKFLDYYTANNTSAHDAAQTIDFLWDGGRYGISAFADILTCEWETLLPLCEEVFVQQVWPRMKDPFVSYAELPDEPLHFTCGSKEELVYITRCIRHASEPIFVEGTDPYGGGCMYYANTSLQKGGPSPRLTHLKRPERDLYGLAFAHNTFQSGKWIYSRYRENTRRKSYRLEPEAVAVQVAPPSAHERAEALLFLYDWLEDKVSEQTRRQWLRLDTPDV